MSDPLNTAFALGEPAYSADFRTELEDFIVVEELGFALQGEGEHLCVQLEKRDENTHWVAENIARQAGVKPMDVGYCGKKDRFAVTTQWFSVYLPRGEIAPEQLPHLGAINPDGSRASTTLLNHARHTKKLRKGEHQSNHFQICLRRIAPEAQPEIDQRLRAIRENGVPNFFGQQRFGRDGNNLNLFNDAFITKKTTLRRKQKSMALSAARSQLFNLVLSARVMDGSWREAETGPLWGRGVQPCTEAVRHYEATVLSAYSAWCDALEHVGLFQQRRRLVLIPESLTWQWLPGGSLELKFSLPAGEYATAVLREVVKLNTVQP